MRATVPPSARSAAVPRGARDDIGATIAVHVSHSDIDPTIVIGKGNKLRNDFPAQVGVMKNPHHALVACARSSNYLRFAVAIRVAHGHSATGCGAISKCVEVVSRKPGFRIDHRDGRHGPRTRASDNLNFAIAIQVTGIHGY